MFDFIQGIEVRFNGKSEVYWKEKVQQSKSSKKDSKEGEDGGEKPAKYAVFDNEETYFESRIYAFGNGSETDLPVGKTFQFLRED